MEGSAEVNEAVETSTGTHHFKRIHMDQAPPQQSGDRESLETPASAVSREMDWHDHFPLMQMHDTSLNGIGEKSAGYIGSHPGSGLPCVSPQSSSDPGVMVEELTLKNFKSPGMSQVGSSTNGEKPPFRTGLWRNFTRIACGADKTSSGSISDGFQDNVCDSSVSYVATRSMLDTTKVCEHRGNFMGSTNVTIKSPDGRQNKTPPSSGFQQFFAKNKSKGKEVVAFRQHSNICDIPGDLVHNKSTLRLDSNLEKMPNSSPKPNAKEKGTCLLDGGSGSTESSPSPNEGMSLREWLKPKRQKINKVERMHIFKQILGLVDICHSQGIALVNLRPSYFVILPINQVKYIGSLSSQGQMVQQPRSREQDSQSFIHHFKRNRYLEQDQEAHDNSMSKHQRIGGSNGIRFGHFGYPLQSGHQMDSEADRNEVDHSRTRQFTYDPRERILTDHHQPFNESHSPSFSSVGIQYFMLEELMKLEDSWYARPEELHDNTSQFSSNIYSLGVLLFELYCCFETWEAQYAAMLDLRLRILPPIFLSESPKEAGFCLWLLHPDPSARPTSRDILLSDLINESRDFSSLDHSSAVIEEEDTEADLLLHFLLCLKEQKEQQLAKLVAGLGCLNTDIEEIEKRHLLRSERFDGSKRLQSNINVSVLDSHEKPVVPESSLSTSHTYEERLVKNMDQLESAYFSMRSKIEISVASTVTRRDNDVLKIRDKYCQIQTDVGENEARDSFGTFFEGLCKYARYSKFEVRGSLKNVDILNSANVICSLSFDRDEEYFAAAGVSKKIKIFEFDALLNDNVDIHYPLIEMSSKSKLSCVCWNNYIKNYLASTDYDGVVQLWDASTAQGFTQFTEHQKRAWSVNFSQVDPIKLASGSDDCYLKLWSINEKNSVDTIKNVANVCCVQFSSYSSHMLAFGSADYKIYCYDLRNTRIPWCTLAGHGKAVSYVKFLESGTLISASTDNTLKLWDLNKTSVSGLSNSACSLTLSGHTNERNFVGLSVCDGYITCGSETNEVYAYYRTFPMPITSHKFGSIDPITAQDTSDDNGQFVSSVCWRGKSNMVVAANSTGSIKVLQLV